MDSNQPQFDKQKVHALINLNQDAKSYFFAKADERWLDWLWANNFLDAIKTPAKDPTRYGYRTPEIGYIAKVAQKAPQSVAQIMLDPETATRKDKFNPELVDWFLRIASSLPPEQLVQVAPKIREQNWARIMDKFTDLGFDYEKILKNLFEAKEYEGFLTISAEVLSIREQEEFEKTGIKSRNENVFCVSHLEHLKVFKYLTEIPSDYAENSLAICTKAFAQIVLLGGTETGENRSFQIHDRFSLYGLDFFEASIGRKQHLSNRDNIQELAVAIKTIVERLFKERCDDHAEVRRLYDAHIETLPDSSLTWRLRLYVLGVCPGALVEKLKFAYFRLFSSKNYVDIAVGAEYGKSLKAAFPTLGQGDQREYVGKLFEYFGAAGEEDRDSHIRYGSRILSVLTEYLSDNERKKSQELGFIIDDAYTPRASVSGSESGFVNAQGAISQEEFGTLPIAEIAKRLRIEWTSQTLREKYQRTDDFLKPHNAEGVGTQLNTDVAARLQKYVDSADLFFDRQGLEPQYTYSFLTGIEDALKAKGDLVVGINWDGLIGLFVTLKKSLYSKPFDDREPKRSNGEWLAGWRSVLAAMADVLQLLVREEKEQTPVFKKHRDTIFDLVAYLLSYPEPTPERESPDNPIMSASKGRGESKVSDPFTIAMNTIRGRGFQILVHFIYPDGRGLPKGKTIRDDVKKLYEQVLARENTRALMFMFGHFLPQFYFRDLSWIQGLLPRIFPTDAAESHLYLAAWEGYAANNLYKEIFDDPQMQVLYARGFEIALIKESTREYFLDPDEGVANHMALGFMHYHASFGFGHPLFKAFWQKGSVEQHKHFVSFLGRAFMSGNNAGADKLLKKEPEVRENLRKLWAWLLDTQTNAELFNEFGHWITLKKDVFEAKLLAQQTKRTLQKTSGGLDWDYGLVEVMSELARLAPEDALEIARLFLLAGTARVRDARRGFHVDGDWIEPLKILYYNPIMKNNTRHLINDLIQEGGSTYWSLKVVFDAETQTEQ